MSFHGRIIGLLNLSQSDSDAEALSAIRKANDIVKKNGLTWDLVVDDEPKNRTAHGAARDHEPRPVNHLELIERIRKFVTAGFDTTFIDDIERKLRLGARLSYRQEQALINIYNAWVRG